MIQLGDKVKCMVSGFEGIATARSEYLNGCIRYGVSPTQLTKEGRPMECEWFDEKQLLVTREQAVVISPLHTGGPATVPKQVSNPR